MRYFVDGKEVPAEKVSDSTKAVEIKEIQPIQLNGTISIVSKCAVVTEQFKKWFADFMKSMMDTSVIIDCKHHGHTPAVFFQFPETQGGWICVKCLDNAQNYYEEEYAKALQKCGVQVEKAELVYNKEHPDIS